jgi:hypothetical protein
MEVIEQRHGEILGRVQKWPSGGYLMTEDEWLAATNQILMGQFLQGRASDRKGELFAVACCRRIWSCLTEEYRNAVELVEKRADGPLSQEELAKLIPLALPPYDILAKQTSIRDRNEIVRRAVQSTIGENPARSPDNAMNRAGNVGFLSDWASETHRSDIQCIWLRDLIGNPFRPIVLAPSWLTTNVRALAQTIYDERDLPSGLFDNHRLAVLADALEEAGCDNADILKHLRGGGEHVRGCWAIDGILSRD